MTVLSALGYGCGEASVEHFEPRGTIPSALDLTLRDGVIPVLLEQGCTSCHQGPAASSNLDLEGGGNPDAVYANLLAGGGRQLAGYGLVVNVAAPAESLLVQAPLEGSNFAHNPKVFGTADDPGYQVLLGWLQNGAPND